MKKQYEKPLIAIEYYELTQSIAACSLKINFLDSMCVLKDADATAEMKGLAIQNYFTSGVCAKALDIGHDEETGICYHTSANAAFNS